MNKYLTIMMLIIYTGVNASYSAEPVIAVLTCAMVGVLSVIGYQNAVREEIERSKQQ